MRTFAYADLGNSCTVGFNLQEWAFPLYVACTSEHCYCSIEIYLLCFYCNVNWSPADNTGAPHE